MAKLLRPREEVRKAIDARIRVGKDLVDKSDVAEGTGGYEDWLFLFENWRTQTASSLTELHDDREIARELTAITQSADHSSARFNFPHRKRALELGLFWLDRLIGRLEVAVGGSSLFSTASGYETGSEAFGKGQLHVDGAAAPHVEDDFQNSVKFLAMAIDRFRNEKSHTADGNISDPVRAYEYLRLSSLALHLLEGARSKA